MVEIPADDAVQFSMPMLAALDETREEGCLNLEGRAGVPVHCGTAGRSSPKVVLSIL